MRRANRSKQAPFLTEYIRYAVDTQANGWFQDLPPFTIALGAGISLLFGGAAMLIIRAWDGTPFLEVATATFGVYMLGAFGISYKRKSKEADPQVELKREARQVAQRLDHCMHEKRLHRDLSVEILALLEEASRNWHRARSALESPYWKRADLPSHLRAVREQSLVAIDQGMQEMLVLFSTSVPKEPGKWTIGELADEVIGQDVFSSRGRLDHISPYYQEAHGVTSKLLELADQVESVSQQLAGQELITGAPKPGSALEATLAELRQLKQAEEELHQDLRS